MENSLKVECSKVGKNRVKCISLRLFILSNQVIETLFLFFTLISCLLVELHSKHVTQMEQKVMISSFLQPKQWHFNDACTLQINRFAENLLMQIILRVALICLLIGWKSRRVTGNNPLFACQHVCILKAALGLIAVWWMDWSLVNSLSSEKKQAGFYTPWSPALSSMVNHKSPEGPADSTGSIHKLMIVKIILGSWITKKFNHEGFQRVGKLLLWYCLINIYLKTCIDDFYWIN